MTFLRQNYLPVYFLELDNIGKFQHKIITNTIREIFVKMINVNFAICFSRCEERSKPDSSNPLTLDDCAGLLRQLREQYYEEYRMYELWQLSLAVIFPLVGIKLREIFNRRCRIYFEFSFFISTLSTTF